MSAWEGSAAQEASGKLPPAAPGKAEEVRKARELLESEGFDVARRAGQNIIQVKRTRETGDDPRWKYTVSKYERNYIPEVGQEIETLTIEVSKVAGTPHKSSFRPK